MTVGDMLDQFGLSFTLTLFIAYMVGSAFLGFYGSRISRWWYEVTGDVVSTIVFSVAWMLSGIELMLFIIQGILND